MPRSHHDSIDGEARSGPAAAGRSVRDSMAGSNGPLVLLSDFGTADAYAGVMKGVVAGIAPGATVIDLSHEIPPHDVRAAACTLLFAHRYFPGGTVFCCVVDPGVGTSRAGLAVEIEGPNGPLTVVCPDNGLLTPLAGSARRAVALDDPRYRLEESSATFHGRDLFAPAAAHLAAGVPLAELGSPRDTEELVRLAWPEPERRAHGLRGEVLHVDRFGNLISNIPRSLLAPDPSEWRVRLAGQTIERVSNTFADVERGAALAYLGSSELLELAVREGSASRLWGAAVGSEVIVERRR